MYPVVDSTTKAPPRPNRVLPKTSVIITSAVNADSSMLALGLENGAVIVWNMRTGIMSTCMLCWLIDLIQLALLVLCFELRAQE